MIHGNLVTQGRPSVRGYKRNGELTFKVRGSRFTEDQMIAALARLESGEAAGTICRDLGITPQTLYRWRWRFGGMDTGTAKLSTELQRERARLSARVRDLATDVKVLSAILTRVLHEPAARRAAAEFAMREFALSERHACRLFAVPRSTMRYRPQREKGPQQLRA